VNVNRLKRIWYLLNMPCHDVADLIARGMDTDLPSSERFAVRLHLLYCRFCRRFKRQLTWLRTMFHEAGRRAEADDFAPPLELSEQARERIRSTLSDQ
jgi:hypothetical protein